MKSATTVSVAELDDTGREHVARDRYVAGWVDRDERDYDLHDRSDWSIVRP